jgi:hypothetical protein
LPASIKMRPLGVRGSKRMRGMTGMLDTVLVQPLENLPNCPDCHLGSVFNEFIQRVTCHLEAINVLRCSTCIFHTGNCCLMKACRFWATSAGDSRGQLGTVGDSRGQLATSGDSRGTVGWGHLGTSGDNRGKSVTIGDCRGTVGDSWGHLGTIGESR